MPVEIKELIIRAVVDLPQESPVEGSAPASQDSAALVQACVREVVRILDKSRER